MREEAKNPVGELGGPPGKKKRSSPFGRPGIDLALTVRPCMVFCDTPTLDNITL